MFNVTGYFNEKGDEYTLNTPKTRASYRTCLVNEKGYLFEADQFGMGNVLCRFKFTKENRVVDGDDRTIYFRDDDTNDLWCVGGFPYVSEVEDFKCTHKQSCTEISSVHNEIKVTIKLFVPVDKYCDIQSVKIENLSGKPRNISIFPAVKLQLDGFVAPRWADNFDQTYLTTFNEEINGLYMDGRNPYTEGDPYNAYLTSTTPITSYSADDRNIFGSQYSLSLPYALAEGEDLDSKSVAAGRLFFMLRTAAKLEDGESFETDYVLGIAKDFETAKKDTADMRTKEDIIKLYEKTEQINTARRNLFHIETPHKETNSFINYWMKMGIERNLILRCAPRDNLQFAHAGLMFVPEFTKYTIKNVMTQQYQDGHILRRWIRWEYELFADAPMWLITTTCDYIKFTGDVEFLDEIVDYFDGGSDTVWVHLMKGINRVDSDRGPHNLPLSHFADWNDALNTGLTDEKAESVFVAMQLALSFKEMSELCKYLGKNKLSDDFKKKYKDMCDTINETSWDDEGYYIRSFAAGQPVGSSKCEKGSKIYVNPQSWAIMSGVCPPERVQSVLDAVDKYIDTPVGCYVNYPAYNEYEPRLGRISFQYPGTSENGAIYAHATSFKMYADCLLGMGDRAYKTYLKLLPSNPDNPQEAADTVPYTLSNYCATADVCYGKSSARPWSTGTMAWLYKTVTEGILGIRFAYDGINFDPAFPSEWDGAKVTLERNGTVYNFSIVNKNTGKKKLFINNTPAEGLFVPFTNEKSVDIRLEI